MSDTILSRHKGKLIVSCQAAEGTPLHGPSFMAAMARAAEMGGAAGIRANGPDDIAAIKSAVSLPVIGIWKVEVPGYDPYITPTLRSAKAVADSGADVIALDATLRLHPGDITSGELINSVKALGLPVMADVSTFEEGVAAAEAGADVVSTTLSGYTPYSPETDQPDFELVRMLARTLDTPVIAEGRIWTPEEARRAIDLGARAVVVGTAITRPWLITERFVGALQ